MALTREVDVGLDQPAVITASPPPGGGWRWELLLPYGGPTFPAEWKGATRSRSGLEPTATDALREAALVADSFRALVQG